MGELVSFLVSSGDCLAVSRGDWFAYRHMSAAKSIQRKAVWAGRNSSFSLCLRVGLREKIKVKIWCKKV